MTSLINASTSAGVVISPDTSGILQLQTAGTAAVTINASQNVGIGIASPAEKLDVATNANAFSTAIKLSNTNAGAGAVTRLSLVNNNSATGSLLMPSSAYTTYGSLISNRLAMYSNDAAGVLIAADNPSGVIAFATGNAIPERMRIDSSGNVGIGTSSPSAKLDVAGNAVLLGTSGYKYLYFNGATESISTRFAKIGKNYDGTFDLGIWAATATAGNSAATVFYRDLTTESMRIDSSGNVLVGTTSVGGAGGVTIAPTAALNGATQIKFNRASTTGISYVIAFQNAGNDVGNINYTNTATTYSTTSDYRLKEKLVPLTGAKDFILSLKPKQGNWKVDGSKFVGFVAHEFAETSASSVSGEKDAVDAEGNPVYQGMQASSPEVMANLISLVQEQQALIESLTTRLTVLEAK